MNIRLATLGVLLLIASSFVPASADRYPSPTYPIMQRSVASVSGADIAFYNPAALRADPGLKMGLYHSFNDSTFDGDNGIILCRGGVGISYHNLHLDAKHGITSWSFAFGTRYSPRFLMGASYTFYKTDREGYSNDHFWKAGFLYRPNTKVSVGATINNINRMEFASIEREREYVVGLGYRPLGKKLTISADYLWYGGEKLKEGILTGFAEYELKKGLWLNGHMDEFHSFGIGLSLAFGASIIGGYADFDDTPEFSRGLITHTYSYERSSYAAFEPDKCVMLKLSGSYPEERQKSFLWRKENRIFADLILGLDKVLHDPHIIGVALYIDRPRLGWAQLEELREKLSEIRQRGKTVVAYLAPLSGTGAYYLASVADEIAIQGLDALSVTGLLAEVTFYKGTLDKLGIVAEVERSGNYKTASDLVTRDELSPYQKEAIDALLDDIWIEVTSKIGESRNMSREDIIAAIDAAPLTSHQALELGLVDTLMYADMFENWASKQTAGYARVSFDKYIRIAEHGAVWGVPPTVTVIPVEGEILRGASSSSLFLGKSVGSSTLNQHIRKARNDRSVKAVVLRVNSPGGEVLGSESIWRELRLTQREKPVIVSMSNIAASGGYHISSAADWILARKMTQTGSIGVTYGKANLSGLREKIGLSTYHLKRGRNADFYNFNRGYTEEQRDKLRSEVDLVYERFVQTVADSRHATYEEIDAVAQGRTWSGDRALEHNLIDQIGGLSDALLVACREANLDRENIVIQIPCTRKQSLFPSMYPLDAVTKIAQFIVNPDQMSISDDMLPISNEGWLYRSPYNLTIR